MKLTLSWLRDHLDTTASVPEIAEALTDLGLEVEDLHDPAAALRPFTIAKVLDAQQHPNADKLRVCRVLTDDGEKQIVCGAPNARTGIMVVLAKPGVYVPGIDTTIGVGKIRGVESFGMMASERELQLSEEHDGIIELPSGEVGESFADWLGANDPARVDPVIEIKITPNRPDALGLRGIARDLAARGLGTLKPLPEVSVQGTFDSPVTVTLDPALDGGCPLFATRLIRGVRNGPSPEWLQARLRAIGLRPISFLVDVTNFFTFDLNRPLHVFDADKLAGGLTVRPAKDGETLVALDGKTYALSAGQIVIADGHGPQSLAGIMGGEETGVTEETVNVLVESALWDPIRVAATGRAQKITSDARYRFERGVDPAFAEEGLDRAVAMILREAGGEASHRNVAGAVPDTARAYRFDPTRLRTLVGMDLPEEEQRRILEALSFRVEGNEAWVPSWRPDVRGDADIVEEVARVASLTRLQGQPLPSKGPAVPQAVLTPAQVRLGAARRMAAALGYNELVTYAFIDGASARLFGGGDEARRIGNPIASDLSDLRPSLLPGLLKAAARNQARGFADLALFEASETFSGGEPGEQRTEVAGLLVGRAQSKGVHGPARPYDVFDAKADLEALLSTLGAPQKLQMRRDGAPWWHPGRHGVVTLGPKTVLAEFGELHPRVLKAMDVKGPAVAFTLWPDAVPLPRATGRTRPRLEASDLQAVERDFAFVVDAGVEAQALVQAAQGADKALISEVRVFDAFQGGSLPEGKKSLALTVRLQPREATLTEKEIEAISAKVIDKVSKATGATLRT
ncbi:Phenylalanyl-tRNA synthetase beta chain [Rubellimicrobium mesophilum DSM 19309]|uniref:Phenylalanine--tRNA ligase beta subunit n=1 Tax=Rubellimicrobium mesophilum DSM 19309 TaxID=442562 RepID=A0A017HLD3_9RHOB|nr:phenylalanine--tRNA ligase subunit beta [Rubellimicrobium mesophilum]EYD74559.1 Phenylalanyl-tRNA synthetase beta chain [Rubellimicrobium mesophilum DSM 19309]